MFLGSVVTNIYTAIVMQTLDIDLLKLWDTMLLEAWKNKKWAVILIVHNISKNSDNKVQYL